jgi:phosphoglycolate phosphatase
MKFEGVIFDLDGTLLNTLEDIADAMNKVLIECSFPIHNYEEYKLFIGSGIRNLVLMALPESVRNEKFIDVCFKKMFAIYGDNCLIKTRLYDGVAEMLDALTDKGIKIAILSNKADALTQFIVKNLFAKWTFTAVLGERTDVPRKPNPAGALEVIKIFGCTPENILYLGDSGVDMQTATVANVYAVGALWGFRSKEELLHNGAKHLVEHPMELLSLL